MACLDISRRGGLEIIGHEGLVQGAYLDDAGIWTIGVRHTAAQGDPDPATLDRELTIGEVVDVFFRDLGVHVAAVNDAVEIELGQQEFDALVSFHRSAGRLTGTSLIEKLNAGDRDRAAREFLTWRRPPEVIPRRTRERRLFAEGTYSNNCRATLYPVDRNRRVRWGLGREIDLTEHL